MMKSIVIALVAIMTTSSAGFAKEDLTTMSSYLGNSANEVAANDSAAAKPRSDNATRLVHDQSQCARGEQLTPVWTNSSDKRQGLLGYTCETFFD
jgi:hypothetical protein